MGSLPPAAGAVTSDPYQLLAEEINAWVELMFHTQVTLVQFPSQGNFLWFYENTNQVFNNGTFGYISARVSPGDNGTGLAKLSGPGGYPNAYVQLLEQTAYSVSTADVAAGRADTAQLAFDGNQLLRDLRQAAGQPTEANGGMTTVDPSTGEVSAGYQVGYGISSPLATINNGLQSNQPVLTVQVPASGGNTATIRYTGCQMVPAQPVTWQQATGTGWYDTDPLAQAYRNGQQDVTGYRFTSGPAYNLEPLASGGNFGRLVSLLISNQPEVSFSSGSRAGINSVSPAVKADFFDSLQLLALDQPTDQPTGQPQLRLAAGSGPTVPLLQQSAYVVGASLDFISQD